MLYVYVRSRLLTLTVRVSICHKVAIQTYQPGKETKKNVFVISKKPHMHVKNK